MGMLFGADHLSYTRVYLVLAPVSRTAIVLNLKIKPSPLILSVTGSKGALFYAQYQSCCQILSPWRRDHQQRHSDKSHSIIPIRRFSLDRLKKKLDNLGKEKILCVEDNFWLSKNYALRDVDSKKKRRG